MYEKEKSVSKWESSPYFFLISSCLCFISVFLWRQNILFWVTQMTWWYFSRTQTHQKSCDLKPVWAGQFDVCIFSSSALLLCCAMKEIDMDHGQQCNRGSWCVRCPVDCKAWDKPTHWDYKETIKRLPESSNTGGNVKLLSCIVIQLLKCLYCIQ